MEWQLQVEVEGLVRLYREPLLLYPLQRSMSLIYHFAFVIDPGYPSSPAAIEMLSEAVTHARSVSVSFLPSSHHLLPCLPPPPHPSHGPPLSLPSSSLSLFPSHSLTPLISSSISPSPNLSSISFLPSLSFPDPFFRSLPPSFPFLLRIKLAYHV